LVIGTPLAWWLATTHSKAKVYIESVVALPLVLPPTVLGFYLLLALSPTGFIGNAWSYALSFSFSGLVIGSVLYSMPFVVQPLQASFEMVGKQI